MRSHVRILVSTLTICLLLLLSRTSARAVGNVTGYVVDSAGNIIAGASVLSGTTSTTTNSVGKYTLTGLSAGSNTIAASATFYNAGSATVTVVNNQTVTAPKIVLASNYGTISGVITDAATLKPIGNTSVTIGGTTLQTKANATGQYTFSKVFPGISTLTISATGYHKATLTVSVTIGSSVTASVAMAANAGISTILWNNDNCYLLGADYAWYSYGTDFGTGAWGKFTDWTSIQNGFATLNSQGVHVVRYWVFADGRYAPQFNADGTVAGLGADVLSNVDSILQIAAATNTYLLLTLIDNNIWSTATTSSGLQLGGHGALVTSTKVENSYLNNALKPLLQHVAASPNRLRVLGYDIVNEPEGQIATYWGGVNLPVSQVQTFVKNCATYIHRYGGGAYATVGSATPYFVFTWKNLGLDFYQVHYYPWMDFSNGAGSGLPTVASLKLDKPCIVGEYATSDASYNIGDSAPQSAQWYLDSVYNKGYAGGLGWSYDAGDSASAWSSFATVFSNWAQTHSSLIGPK